MIIRHHRKGAVINTAIRNCKNRKHSSGKRNRESRLDATRTSPLYVQWIFAENDASTYDNKVYYPVANKHNTFFVGISRLLDSGASNPYGCLLREMANNYARINTIKDNSILLVIGY